MKTLLCLIYLLAIAAPAQSLIDQGGSTRESRAQIKAGQDKERGEYNLASLGTNWVRVVDGKTNFLRYATNWTTIPEFLGYHADFFETHSFKVEVIQKDGVIVRDEHRTTFRGRENFEAKFFLLKNWPGAATAVSEDSVFDSGVRASFPGRKPMRVTCTGRTEYGSSTIPIYDYGTPITITNAPASRAAK